MDPVELAGRLIRFDTINPPGNETACAEHLGELLSRAGFQLAYHELAPGRANLIARLGDGSGKPLCLTGHLDTVPLGAAPWTVAPHGGDVRDGRLWGRGASDMKAGIAAITVAALAEIEAARHGPGVVLVFTAGEETGCEGAFALARKAGALGEAGAIIVAEPTANAPLLGHRGAFWLRATTSGVTAHGATPELGVNAVYAAARAVTRLEGFGFGVAPHPVMGAPTLNVGTFHGGINFNSVPDRAEIGVDIRTVPGLDHAALLERLRGCLGAGVAIAPVVDIGPLWSDPDHRWIGQVFDAVARVTGHRPEPGAAGFVTDAAALAPAYGHPPTVILGPGEPAMAHKTDEWCDVARIDQAVALYRDLIRRWCRPAT